MIIKASNRTQEGDMGIINGRLFLFSTEEDYVEYVRIHCTDSSSEDEEEEED